MLNRHLLTDQTTLILYFNLYTPATYSQDASGAIVTGPGMDLSAIKHTAVTAVTNVLNEYADEGEPKYSEAQVKAAMWEFLNNEIYDLQEEIGQRFLDKLHRLTVKEQERLLGKPEGAA